MGKDDMQDRVDLSMANSVSVIRPYRCFDCAVITGRLTVHGKEHRVDDMPTVEFSHKGDDLSIAGDTEISHLAHLDALWAVSRPLAGRHPWQ